MYPKATDRRSLVDRFRLFAVSMPTDNNVVETRVGSRARIGLLGLSFIICVLLPVLVAVVYLVFIASEEYVSESHFTIRAGTENRSAITDALSAMTTSFGSSTSQDVFIVADYIKSRTIIQDIGGKERLVSIFSRPETNWLSRLESSESLEKIWKYWRRKVSAVIDTPSGVITLNVRAFTPESAILLAQLIVERSEALVNEISERSRRDALSRAEQEVRLAADRLEKARTELLVFRTQNNLIDPTLSAKSLSENIGKLSREKIMLQFNRGSVSGSMGSDSPTLRILNAQIAAIDRQITQLQEQLTSQGKDTALASQIAGFENLQLGVLFGERLYSIAQASYERARIEQEKQQLYLVTIEKPNRPEKPLYPRIFLDTVLIFATFFTFWSMVTLVVAWIRDHAGE